MSAVRSSRNKTTELRFIEILRANKITGWRRRSIMLGKPDFVFTKKKVAIFIDGCFWHGCKKCRTIPKQNNLFWKNKIGRNVERDREVTRGLKREGWKVLRIWEHGLKKNFESVVTKISKILQQEIKK
jgi:DNA mismatch endonuclease (patch repair protein)